MPVDQALARKRQELSVLYEVSSALGSSFDLDDWLHRVLLCLADQLGMTRGAVALASPYAEEVQIEVSYGLSPDEVRRGRYQFGEGITGRVVASGEPAVVPNIGRDPLFLNRTLSRDLSRADISFLCVPIRSGSEVLGALSVDRLFNEDIQFEEDIRLLTIVATMIGQAVKMHRLVEDERQKLTAEKDRLQADLQRKFNVTNIIGNSKAMHQVFAMIAQVAKSNATVLIRGESGTGKELVAHAIHYNSPRAKKPFVKINCSAIPETLIESELFGHEKGAFTGAVARKPGKFEIAEGGTIFLDEIGDVNASTQVKLLRVLQEKEFERVGGWETIKGNVRVIAATNRNLEDAMVQGVFREDLYYRLNVFPIYMPPLRERKTDILLLAEHFLEQYARENGKEIRRITTPAIDMLMRYHWPGNVRELENCLERAVLLCEEPAIHSYHLPATLQTADETRSAVELPFEEAVRHFETDLIVDALKAVRGNMRKAAERLETTPRILGYKVHKYRIEPRRYR
ncbi:MAG: nif-specific transcriptional activator NifA [Deltaproteobacteria bacterium]|nr:nif-specific transcriptional activator NifA [Deltaproteobacteria bacterium]